MKNLYYYQIKEDGTACLLRCFGESPKVLVPEKIDGCLLSEIGPYCFAANAHLDGKAYRKSACSREDSLLLTEQAGRYLQSVSLPDGIKKIGAYAFYGCRCLKEISTGQGVEEAENDVFMNCTSLWRIIVRGSIRQASGLKLYLAQISWNLQVDFMLPETDDGPEIREASLLFPEYLEYYDEIGPAHVFELQIEGEGFRARKAFDGGILNLAEYDSIFPKASVEEKEETVCPMALLRCLYPAGLSEERRQQYGAYLKDHQQKAAQLLCFPKEGEREADYLEKLERLIAEGLLEKPALEELLALSAEREEAELCAALIRFRRIYFAAANRKKRYSFDD